MPKFDLTTVERREQKVNYYGVEADSLQEAYEMICDHDVSYDEHEIIEDGDEVLCLWHAEDEEGNELEIPESMSTEPPSHHELIKILMGFMDWIPEVKEGEAGYEVQQLAKKSIAQYTSLSGRPGTMT